MGTESRSLSSGDVEGTGMSQVGEIVNSKGKFVGVMNLFIILILVIVSQVHIF